MRKYVYALVILLFVLMTITGCAKPKNDDTTIPSETITTEENTSGPEEKETEESTIAEEKKVSETTCTESSVPSITTSEETTVQPKQETKPSNTKPSESSKPADTSKPTEQTKPAETTKPQETTKPTEPVKPVHTHSYSKATCIKPATCSCGATSGTALGHQYASATCTKAATCTVCGATTGSALGHNYSNGKCTRCGKDDPNYKPPEPKFDINEWVSYAKSYAKSVGLELDSEAVECWDNPIGWKSSYSDTDVLKGNIQSRMNRYAKDDDITAVWVWYESTGNGSYDLYIGYA